MKQIITLMILCLAAGAVMAQPALKVDAQSQVGVGIDNPLTAFHINQFEGEAWLGSTRPTGQANARFAFLTAGTTTVNGTVGYAFGANALFVEQKLADDIVFETSDAERMRLKADGKLGVGTQTPQYTLDVNGDAGKNGTSEFLVTSDRRLKKNINEFQGGLQEILKLNPVTFQYNGKGGVKNTDETYVGLIAQEYQKVAPYAVQNVKKVELETVESDDNRGDYDDLSDELYNSLYKKRTQKVATEKDYLAIDASPIRFMLVNAIKEQNSQIVDLQKENEDLRTQISEIRAMLQNLDGKVLNETLTNDGTGLASLNQNTPNPFSSATEIGYSLPESATSGELRITDISGKLLKTISLQSGKGSVNLNSESVPSGQYFYSLIVDGELVETKKMIIND